MGSKVLASAMTTRWYVVPDAAVLPDGANQPQGPAAGVSAPLPGDTGGFHVAAFPSLLTLEAPSEQGPVRPAEAIPARQAAATEALGLLGQLTKLFGDIVKLLPSLVKSATDSGRQKSPRKSPKKPARHKPGKPRSHKARKAKDRGGAANPQVGKAARGKESGEKASATPKRGPGGRIKTATRNGKPIGAAIAPAFDRMAAAAKRDGVTLQVNSGYRSHAEQVRLWNANPNPTMVARPGTSNHEKGNAIDFAGIGRAWTWLKKNATRFGFRNYPAEAWHYDYVG